jgi:hypothetical protein
LPTIASGRPPSIGLLGLGVQRHLPREDDSVAVQVFLDDLDLVLLRAVELAGQVDQHRRPAVRPVALAEPDRLDDPGDLRRRGRRDDQREKRQQREQQPEWQVPLGGGTHRHGMYGRHLVA